MLSSIDKQGAEPALKDLVVSTVEPGAGGPVEDHVV